MKDGGNSEIEWIIHFKGNKPETYVEEKKPKSLVQINNEPLSHKKRLGSWLKGDPETQKKALESLEAIIEACKEIKGDCMKTIEQPKDKDKEERIGQITNELKGLFYLIVEFTKLIKKIREGQDKEKGGSDS